MGQGSRSSNMSGGSEAMRASSIKKKATSHARGTKQKRGEAGNAKSKTMKAKWQKRNSSGKESLDEMEF